MGAHVTGLLRFMEIPYLFYISYYRLLSDISDSMNVSKSFKVGNFTRLTSTRDAPSWVPIIVVREALCVLYFYESLVKKSDNSMTNLQHLFKKMITWNVKSDERGYFNTYHLSSTGSFKKLNGSERCAQQINSCSWWLQYYILMNATIDN